MNEDFHGEKGIIGVIGFFAVVLLEPDEEPFSLFEGISIWPTEIIRLLAITLSIAFVVISRKVLKKNTQEIDAEFFGSVMPGRGHGEPGRSSPRDGKHRLIHAWERVTYCASKDTFTTMDELWNTYREKESLPHKLAWIVPVGLLYFLFYVFIIKTTGTPSKPLRGTVSSALDLCFCVLLRLFSCCCMS